MTINNPLIPKLTIINGPMMVPMIVPIAISAIRNDMALARSSSPTRTVIHVIGVGINDIAINKDNTNTQIVNILMGS